MLDFSKKVVTVEVNPPSTPDLNSFLSEIEGLKRFDGVNVTELAMRREQDRWMSTVYTAIKMKEAGFNPIPHMTCRDHNRRDVIASSLALMSAGVDNVLAITGDEGISKGVYELSVTDMLSLIKKVYEEQGHAVQLVAAANLHNELDLEVKKARAKVKAGASVLQTQPVFDVKRLRRFVEEVGGEVKVLAGLMPIKGREHASRLERRLGIVVPDELKERFSGMSVEEVREEMFNQVEFLFKELIEAADGVHLYPMGEWEVVERVKGLL